MTGMARVLLAGMDSIGGWLVWGRGLVEGAGAWLAAPALLLLPARLTGTRAAPVEPPWPLASREVEAFIEDSKYDLGGASPDLRLERYEEREPGELPSAYGVDRITLLARDPWCLFAYWELTPGRRAPVLEALGREVEGACQVLRLYAVSSAETGTTVSFDVDLPADLGSRYLTVASPGASCRAEIGLSMASGRFVPLASSNTVILPSATPSGTTSVRWTDVTALPSSTH